MSELKPCPFCGGPANIAVHTDILKQTLYGVGCAGHSCADCPTRPDTDYYSNKEKAIAAWNTRVTEVRE